ncbi:MAG: methyltransferase domain-containing protein [Acidobacteria bacterium]|nr:methyltransferase domain-containing protein [Acidobacteriota bacterium]
MSGESKTVIPEKREWDAASYDKKHSFVWKYGTEVVELLAARKGERILDLGCGTGHLTHQIALSGAEVIGLDRSSEMIEQARKAYPQITFVLGDGYDFRFDEPFEAVFSNAALHWMTRPGAVADCISRALKPGGRLVAEFGGKGNLHRLHAAVKTAMSSLGYPVGEELDLWYFPRISEYATLLEKRRLEVTYAVLFDRPTALEGGDNGLREWLETFTSNFLARLTGDERPQFFKQVEAELRPVLFRDGTWFADYRRIRVVAVRD